MKTRNFLLFVFVGMMLCLSSPAFAGTIVLFEDNFDSDAVGAFPDNPTTGTWVQYGGESYPSNAVVTDSTSPGAVSSPYYLTLSRPSDGTWVGAEATFTRQTTATDLVRIEFDSYAGTYQSGSTYETAYIKLSDTVSGNYQYFFAYGNGTVQSPGGDLNGLVLNAWNHWVIEYYPGAATSDVTISGILNEDVATNGTMTGIDAVHFASLWSGVGAARFDNIEVTVSAVPEPSTIVLLTCGLLGLMVCVRKKRK